MRTLTKTLDLAARFASDLALVKSAGKKPMSRVHIQKSIEKAKKQHALLKKEHDSLEADDTKLQTKLKDTRDKLHFTRKQLMQMHRGMQCMDMANANDAVFYDDDDQIGYVVDGKEYHLEVDSGGEISLTPMGKYRKEQKAAKTVPVEEKVEDESEEPEETESEEELDEDEDVEPKDLSDEDLLDFLHHSSSGDEE